MDHNSKIEDNDVQMLDFSTESCALNINLKPIDKNILGQIVSIGKLYDLKSEQIVPFSIFKEPINKEILLIKNFDEPTQQFQLYDFINDNFLDNECALSLLAGMLKTEGPMKLISSHNSIEKNTYTCFLINKLVTVQEDIDLEDEKVKNFLSTEVLKVTKATHVVVGVRWGAITVVRIEYKAEVNEEIEDISEKIKILINKLMKNNYNESELLVGEKEIMSKLSFEISSNLAIGNKSHRTTKEIFSILRDIKQLKVTDNKGKGKPLEFSLIPISSLTYHNMKNIELYFETPKEMIDKITKQLKKLQDDSRFYDEKVKVLNQINDFINLTDYDALYFKLNQMNSLICMKNKIKQFIILARSGKNIQTDVDVLFKEIDEKREIIVKEINELFIETTQRYQIDKIKEFVSKGIKYVSRFESVKIEKNQTQNDVYVLYISSDLKFSTENSKKN